MAKSSKLHFKHLVSVFPEVELPIILSSDIHHVFSRQNDPLPQGLIIEFLSENPDEDQDGLTEYVPCFRLPAQEHYLAIVYWKASLMEYEYFLLTFDRSGNPINKKIIAGTKSNGDTILTRVATIDEECLISIAEGVGQADGKNYDAGNSNTYQLEISPTGDILYMLEEH